MQTLGCLCVGLFLQVQGESVSGGSSQGIRRLIADLTPLGWGVIILLAVFSITSWSIILYKFWTFQRAQRQSTTFLEVFRRSSKFSEVQAVCRSLAQSPLVGLFQAGYAELTTQLKAPAAELPNGVPHPRAVATRPTLKSLPAVDRALLRASAVEVNRLEKRLPFLATTASISPFIGLFGTVWGIMMAFLGISETGSTNLGSVAPGIAEALVATAAGLFAAIPAVYFYNHLTNQVKQFASALDDFALEFLNIAERNFT